MYTLIMTNARTHERKKTLQSEYKAPLNLYVLQNMKSGHALILDENYIIQDFYKMEKNFPTKQKIDDNFEYALR